MGKGPRQQIKKKIKKNTHSDSRHLIVSATQSDQDLTGTFKPAETKKQNKKNTGGLNVRNVISTPL